MNIPEELKYTKDHEWVRLDGDMATVGVSDFAQGELGDIIFIEFPEVGETFGRDEVFGTVEAVKTVADLFMPVSGEIAEINSALEDAPENVNSDPYKGGWLVKVKMSDAGESNDLLDAAAYKELLA